MVFHNELNCKRIVSCHLETEEQLSPEKQKWQVKTDYLLKASNEVAAATIFFQGRPLFFSFVLQE